jgi:hypothetical protein
MRRDRARRRLEGEHPRMGKRQGQCPVDRDILPELRAR